MYSISSGVERKNKEGVYRPWEVLIKVSAACTPSVQERKNKEGVYRPWEVLII